MCIRDSVPAAASAYYPFRARPSYVRFPDCVPFRCASADRSAGGCRDLYLATDSRSDLSAMGRRAHGYARAGHGRANPGGRRAHAGNDPVAPFSPTNGRR